MRHKRRVDYEWKLLRERILTEEPLCRMCRLAGRVTGATELDHIVPLHLGGGHERANLQPLCSACHETKTNEERRARLPVRGCTLDGVPLARL